MPYTLPTRVSPVWKLSPRPVSIGPACWPVSPSATNLAHCVMSLLASSQLPLHSSPVQTPILVVTDYIHLAGQHFLVYMQNNTMVRLSLCLNHQWTKVTRGCYWKSTGIAWHIWGPQRNIKRWGDNLWRIWLQTSCSPSCHLGVHQRLTQSAHHTSNGPAELCVKAYNTRKITGQLGPLSIMVTLQTGAHLKHGDKTDIIRETLPHSQWYTMQFHRSGHLILHNYQFLHLIQPVCSRATCPLSNFAWQYYHGSCPGPHIPAPKSLPLHMACGYQITYHQHHPHPITVASQHLLAQWSAPRTPTVFHANNANAIPTCWDFAPWVCSFFQNTCNLAPCTTTLHKVHHDHTPTHPTPTPSPTPTIQTGVTVRKCLIWVWPRKTIRHLFYATSSFVHHFVAIGEFKLELQSRNA